MIIRQVSEPFFDELMEELSLGCHVALLAPRQSAKAVVLFELMRRAELSSCTAKPRVILLRPLELAWLDDRDFVNALSRLLGVNRLPAELTDPGHPLPERIIGLLHAAMEDSSHLRKHQPLWLFVQNVTELPAPHARALLTAFQIAAEDQELRQRLSVVATGSRGLVPLTYSQNSPYRHAKKYFLTGLDRDYSESFVRARLTGASLHQGFQSVSNCVELIEPEAMDYLFYQTGGYAKFLEEIVVTARRPGIHGNDTRIWTIEIVKELVNRFIQEYLHKEYDCSLSLREVERDRDAWERLQKLVDRRDPEFRIMTEEPDPLELAGIVRRDTRTGQALISSPIWDNYLTERLDSRRPHRADRYALLGEWDLAWRLYESSRSSVNDRVLDGIERYSLDNVLTAWEQSLVDKIRTGSAMVVKQFLSGVRHLLGFTWFKLSEQDQIIAEFESHDPEDQNGLSDAHFDSPDYGEKGRFTLFLAQGTRHCIQAALNRTGNDSSSLLDLKLEGGYPSGQAINVIDTAILQYFQRALRQFWLAFDAARRFEYDATIGDLRERHLLAIKRIGELLSLDAGNMQSVVEGTAKALVDIAGYQRIQICLVSPKRDFIQSVASCCKPNIQDFNFRTDCDLDLGHTDASWDIQKWVSIKGETVAIPNASNPKQQSPTTQWKKVSLIGMKAIVVVPIKLAPSTRDSTVEILGTIHFEREDGELPDRQEIELYEILAGQIAVIFDQARRTTLLEQALQVLDDPVRILPPNENSNDVIFRNRASARIDQVETSGWQSSYATSKRPDVAITNNSDHRRRSYFLDDAERIWDDLQVPLLDFRSQLRAPFKADGRIGVVQHQHDLTELVTAYIAFQHWLQSRDERETAGRVLEYFQCYAQPVELCRWCRIYLIRKSPSGVESLESFAEFGIKDPEMSRRFRRGTFRTPPDAQDRQAWFLLNELKAPAVFRFDACHTGLPVEIDSACSGIKTFKTADHWREEFGKTDQEWIEAPLLVGNERVGLIAFAKPLQFSPRLYEQLRWCVGSVAIALWNARQAELRSAAEREMAWKQAAQLAIHQLTNKLRPAEEAAEFTLAELSRSQDASDSFSLNARQSLASAHRNVVTALDILKNFGEFASDKPFADLRDYPVADVIRIIDESMRDAQLGKSQRDTQTNGPSICVRFDGSKGLIRTSKRALTQIFGILFSNSVLHSGKKRDLAISIDAMLTTDGESQGCCLQVIYRDNGKGVAPELKNRIFDPFFTTHPQGNGLGLVIAQQFMHRLGGHIELASTHPDSGACFALTLPMKTEDKGPRS